MLIHSSRAQVCFPTWHRAMGPRCGVGAGTGQWGSHSGGPESTGRGRTDAKDRDAKDRGRLQFVAKSPPHVLGSARLIKRGEKGVTSRIQSNVPYLLSVAGSRFRESIPPLAPALFSTGFIFR